jgi:hypothetical protein
MPRGHKPNKGHKHNKKNADFVLLERRTKVARHYCEGKSQAQIAEIMDLNVMTVNKDLARVREYWLALMMADFDQRKCQELAKIDYLEATAWRAWKRSTRPAQTRHLSVEKGFRVVQKKDRNGQPLRGVAPVSKMMPVREIDDTTEKTQAGDPRFLEIVSDCIDKRLKLMGLLDDRTANVYLDFSGLFQKKQQELEHRPSGDVIENIIASVGLPVQEETNGTPPQVPTGNDTGAVADAPGSEGTGTG